MGDVADETAHVAILDELRHALADVVKEPHGVAKEVHGAQDLSGLADQLLHTGRRGSGGGQEGPSFRQQVEVRVGPHLTEVLEDVIEDDFLGLVGVHAREGIHVDHGVLKADEWNSQGAFESLSVKHQENSIDSLSLTD